MLDIDLFRDIDEDGMLSLLKCLDIKTELFKKGSVILSENKNREMVGVILDGSAQIEKSDINGKRIILRKLFENDTFGEITCALGIKDKTLKIFALSSCEVLFIPYNKLLNICENACSHHKILLKNLFNILAKKNYTQSFQTEILAQRSIRDKLSAYLKMQSLENNSNKFTIPLNRNEMADFLCTDRSAMSRELCRMRDDKILNFDKNSFEILIEL